MVQKVTGFKAEDGQVFDTEALALAHEKGLLLGAAVKAALVALGFGEGVVYPKAPHDDGSTDLQDFLLNNSEALILALTPPKKERKPRASKEPTAPNTTLTGALEALGAAGLTGLKAGTESVLDEAATTLVKDAPDTAAGDAADDELAALLGGTSSEVVV